MRLSPVFQTLALAGLLALSTPQAATAADNATIYANCRTAGGTMHACCDKVGGGYSSSIKTGAGGKTIIRSKCVIVSVALNKQSSTKTVIEELPQVAVELQE
jgi:hypothetical protein